jgi:hypothetical protein
MARRSRAREGKIFAAWRVYYTWYYCPDMLGTKRMRALSAEADDALVQMQKLVDIHSGSSEE